MTDQTNVAETKQASANFSIKIGVLADTHLRLMHYGNAARGEQILNTLLRAITFARANEVKYLCCAGDFLDSNNPGIDVVARYIPEVDKILRDLGMTMFITKGNHDTVSPSWYSIVGNNRETTGGIIPVKDGEIVQIEGGVRIKGYDWGNKDRFRELVTNSSTFEDADLVMLHGEIRELCGFPTDSSVSLNDFVFPDAGGARAVLVGHIHVEKIHDAIYNNHRRVIISPGATDITSMVDASESGLLPVVIFTPGQSEFEIAQLHYAKTWNHIFTVYTEDPNILKYIKDHTDEIQERGGVVYLKHKPSTLEAAHAIRQAILALPEGKDIVVVQSMLNDAGDGNAFEEVIIDARTAKEEISSYFAVNATRLMPEEYRDDKELINLGVDLLKQDTNAKVVLEQYIEKETGAIML